VTDLYFRTGHLAQLFYYVFFLQNFQMAATGTFGGVSLGITWSLAVEQQFYLSLPLVIRSFSRRILWRVLLGAILAAPLVRVLAIRLSHGNWVGAYVLMPCRADALCLGVLTALAVRDPAIWTKLVTHCKAVYAAFALAACAGASMVLGSFQPCYDTVARDRVLAYWP
jgi:peptidoglycan/LPS O-acetylase OafA/YrhL